MWYIFVSTLRYNNRPNCRYDEEREKCRGFSQRSDRDLRDRGDRGPPCSPRDAQRFTRGSYKGDRNTIDRDRFSRHSEREPEIFDDEESIEEAGNSHVARRDRMREREKDLNDINYGGSPKPNRQMRHSEDRQMGSSPRFSRPNGPGLMNF